MLQHSAALPGPASGITSRQWRDVHWLSPTQGVPSPKFPRARCLRAREIRPGWKAYASPPSEGVEEANTEKIATVRFLGASSLDFVVVMGCKWSAVAPDC